MAQAPHAFLLAAVLLSGCTLFGNESTDVDKSEYDGGIGFALVVTNTGEDPFDVKLRVLSVGNAQLAALEKRLGPGERIEKWWDLDSRSTYSARLDYTWNSSRGSTSHGFDDQTFDAQECPKVSRIEWELRQDKDVVGHAFLGKTCVADDEG